jgi:hypothetical protein
MERRKAYFFAVDEDRDEDDEEADESFLEMEELFHLKFGKKSKKNAAGQNDDIPEHPKSMAQQGFNPEEEDSLGTLDKYKARRKERLLENLKAQRPSNTFNPTTGESTVEGDDSRSGNSDHTPSARGRNSSSHSSSSTSSSESHSEGHSRSTTKITEHSGGLSDDEDSSSEGSSD